MQIKNYKKTIEELLDESKYLKNETAKGETADNLMKKLKEMRMAGLQKEGEFSVENQVFKKLRNEGVEHIFIDFHAEATAEKLHETIRKTIWGYAPDEDLTIKQLHQEKYQGMRPAVGYPSLPDLSINFLLDELLDMKQIGITLTENGMMRPHASVSGLMLAHPACRHFSVGKIDEAQLKNYALRRGMPLETMKKFLIANI